MDSLLSGLDAARRTPRAFRNWPVVLTTVGVSLLTGRPRILVVRTRSGLRLRCPNRPCSRATLWEVLVDDCYRLAWFLHGGPTVTRVLDVGAQVGTFALHVAELCPAATVDCYEPSPATFDFLRANAAVNLPGRIVIHAQAVMGESGTATLYDDDNGSCANSVFASLSGCGRPVQVQAAKLADILATATTPFDLVKLDCEGAEYAAVLSTPPAAWLEVRRVVLEYHPVDGYGWPQLAAYFRQAGFVELEHVRAKPSGQGWVWLARPPADGAAGKNQDKAASAAGRAAMPRSDGGVS